MSRRNRIAPMPHSPPERSTAVRAQRGVLPGELPDGRTWCRLPFGSVGFVFEVRADHIRTVQIYRIFDNSIHKQQATSIRKRGNVEILCDRGALAIRHAILPQISCAQVGCHHVQAATCVLPGRALPVAFESPCQLGEPEAGEAAKCRSRDWVPASISMRSVSASCQVMCSLAGTLMMM